MTRERFVGVMETAKKDAEIAEKKAQIAKIEADKAAMQRCLKLKQKLGQVLAAKECSEEAKAIEVAKAKAIEDAKAIEEAKAKTDTAKKEDDEGKAKSETADATEKAKASTDDIVASTGATEGVYEWKFTTGTASDFSKVQEKCR